jgi:hypothetical protein
MHRKHKPTRVPMPSIARQVVALLGQEERWEGTATELAASIRQQTSNSRAGVNRESHHLITWLANLPQGLSE